MDQEARLSVRITDGSAHWRVCHQGVTPARVGVLRLSGRIGMVATLRTRAGS